MKRLFSLILVGMLAVSGLSAKVKLSVLYVGGTANMDPMLMAPGSVDSVALAASVKERMAHFTKFLKGRTTLRKCRPPMTLRFSTGEPFPSGKATA